MSVQWAAPQLESNCLAWFCVAGATSFSPTLDLGPVVVLCVSTVHKLQAWGEFWT